MQLRQCRNEATVSVASRESDPVHLSLKPYSTLRFLMVCEPNGPAVSNLKANSLDLGAGLPAIPMAIR